MRKLFTDWRCTFPGWINLLTIGSCAPGYRACDELFSEGPHELKLLLINSIRSVGAPLFKPEYLVQLSSHLTLQQDLYASPGLANAEARWTLGLRAAASARIGTRDLPPAVADRVLQLFSGPR